MSLKHDPWPWLKAAFTFRTLIDIGANVGDYGAFIARYLELERCYFFEPSSAADAIAGHAAGLVHHQVLNTALSDVDGPLTFIETTPHAASSFLGLSAQGRGEYPQIAEARRYKVEARRLDAAAEGLDLRDDIFIKMDVQGAEDRVIRGGPRTFGRARAVLVEMSFTAIYEGQPLFEEVHALLAACGLRLAGVKNQILSEQTGRPLFSHCLYLRPTAPGPQTQG